MHFPAITLFTLLQLTNLHPAFTLAKKNADAESSDTAVPFRYSGITDPVLGKLQSSLKNEEDQETTSEYTYSFGIVFIVSFVVVLVAFGLAFLLLYLHSFCWNKQRTSSGMEPQSIEGRKQSDSKPSTEMQSMASDDD